MPWPMIQDLYTEAISSRSNGERFASGMRVHDRRCAGPGALGTDRSLISYAYAQARYGRHRDALLNLDVLLQECPDHGSIDPLMDVGSLAQRSMIFVFACQRRHLPHSWLIVKHLNLIKHQFSPHDTSPLAAQQRKVAIMKHVFELLQCFTAVGGQINAAGMSSVMRIFQYLAIRSSPSHRLDPTTEEYNGRLMRMALRLTTTFTGVQDASDEAMQDAIWRLLRLAVHTGNLTAAEPLKAYLESKKARIEYDYQATSMMCYESLQGGLDSVHSLWNDLVELRHGCLRGVDYFALVAALKELCSRESSLKSRAHKFLHSQLSIYPPRVINPIEEYMASLSSQLNEPYWNSMLGVEKNFEALGKEIEKAVDQLLSPVGPDFLLRTWLRHGPWPRDSNIEVQEASVTKVSPPLPCDLASRVATNNAENFEMILRKVCDELTRHPDEPAEPHGKPQLSACGLPYDVLRYENWKTINRLLAMNEVSEKAEMDCPRNEGGSGGKHISEENRGDAVEIAQLDAFRDWDGELGIGLDATYGETRKRIFDLRGLAV